MKEKSTVGQSILLPIPRLAKEQVGFRLFEDQGESARHVGDGADEDHLDAGQSLRKAEENGGEDGHELREGSGREKVEDALLEVLEAQPAGLDAHGDRRELVQEDQVGGFHRDLGSSSNGNADVGLLESGCTSGGLKSARGTA